MKTFKRIHLYIFLLMVVLVWMLLLRKKTDELPQNIGLRDYEQIMQSGELNVVTDYNSIGYFVESDSVAGFQYEMLRALEKSWNVKLNIFLENSLDENLQGLSAQKYDIIARNIPINTELKDTVAFVETISFNKQVLVQRSADFNDGITPIRRHLDLAKQTIYVPEDSPAILRLNNLSHEIGDTIFIEQHAVYEAEQLVMMVAAGYIDYAVCDEKVARRLAARLPEIDIETDISFTQLEAWAVRKNSPALLDSLNAWFGTFRQTKEFKKIYRKYY